MKFKLIKSLIAVSTCILLTSCSAFVYNIIPKNANESVSSSSNVSVSTSSTETSNVPLDPTNIEIVKHYDADITISDREFEYKEFNDSVSGNVMPYRLRVPKNHNPKNKYPVLLFLHGAGETGNDNEKQLRNFVRCFDVASDILQDAIIVCPQTPSSWSTDIAEPNDQKGYLCIAKRILDSVIKKYNGDYDRLYLTGLSLGSFATWTMLDTYQVFFAAAVPVCGGTGSYAPWSFVQTPIWIYHGTADTTVSFSSSEETYNAIKAAGGNKVRFTRLEGVGHNAWDYAYTDREMFSWMFSQNLRQHQSENYDYISGIEVLSHKGKQIFNEKDIEGAYYKKDGDNNFIELQLSDDAYDLMKKEYDKNSDKAFRLKVFQKKIYDFKFTEFPEDKTLRIEDAFGDTDFYSVHRFIQTVSK